MQYRDTRSLKPRVRASRTSFVRHYATAEAAIRANTDSLHDTLSGPATKVLLLPDLTLFGDARVASAGADLRILCCTGSFARTPTSGPMYI